MDREFFLRPASLVVSAGLSLPFCESESRSVVSDSLRPYGLNSPAGFSVLGILQARILVVGCHSLLRGITHISCLLHWQVSSLPLVLPGKPNRGNKQRL